jgi:hypothetical protein
MSAAVNELSNGIIFVGSEQESKYTTTEQQDL